MPPRILTLNEICRALTSLGTAHAFAATRRACESGTLHPLDVPEVMLAVQDGSATRIEEISRNRPGRLTPVQKAP